MTRSLSEAKLFLFDLAKPLMQGLMPARANSKASQPWRVSKREHEGMIERLATCLLKLSPGHTVG